MYIWSKVFIVSIEWKISIDFIQGKRFNDQLSTEIYGDVTNRSWIASSMERGKWVCVINLKEKEIFMDYFFFLFSYRTSTQSTWRMIDIVQKMIWNFSSKIFWSIEEYFSNIYFRNNVPILRDFPIDRLNQFPHAIQHCNYG